MSQVFCPLAVLRVGPTKGSPDLSVLELFSYLEDYKGRPNSTTLGIQTNKWLDYRAKKKYELAD
jgi:hypothetical protein